MNFVDNLPQEYKDRLEKLNKLKSSGINPYPANVRKDFSVAECFAKEEDQKVQTAGRIVLKRDMGKLIFCHISDQSGKMQFVLELNHMNEERFHDFQKLVDVADFVEVEGKIFFTKKGEKSILIDDWRMISKSLLPLAEKWHGIEDEDLRYRKRYLDFISNSDVKELMIKKSIFWDNVRNFLKEKGFLEVETPYLEITSSGADARPFVGHHNDFDIDVFFRICIGELWQKKMLVGGFDKTFEIGRAFRNEGSSPNHLQEFTNCEFYWGYADERDGMKLARELYIYIAKNTFDKTKFEIGEYEVDLEKEWEEIDYRERILKETNLDINTVSDDDIRNKLKELNIKYEEGNRARLIDSIWKYCRKKISGPAFLINVPLVVSPLAKPVKEGSLYTRRFQPILAGTEIGNGFSELNDPLDQLARFEEQQAMRDAGDEEAQMADYTFVEALMHGMPPACGFGFGQRLFAMMAGVPIRETESFPLVKPK